MTTREQGTQTAADESQLQDEGVQANVETDESLMVAVRVKQISGLENKRKRLSIRLVVSEGHPATKKRKYT